MDQFSVCTWQPEEVTIQTKRRDARAQQQKPVKRRQTNLNNGEQNHT